MKPIIIAIVGASGAGKTHLSKFLEKNRNIPTIVSVTTRPQRTDEVDGVDYFFVENSKEYDKASMLTYTTFGKHEYFALRQQLPLSGFCTYVVDEKGVRALKNKAGNTFGLFTVTIICSKEKRLQRGVDPIRIARDENRGKLDYECVDYVIFNNGSLEEFERASLEMMKVLETWQHLL